MNKNVFGKELVHCCLSPITGFFRDGFCRTDKTDHGRHTVCAQMTDAFLQFSRQHGNDLSTPRPEFDFPGLKAGDRWCVCVLRWAEALDHGVAPPVILDSCDESVLQFVSMEDLEEHAIEAAH